MFIRKFTCIALASTLNLNSVYAEQKNEMSWRDFIVPVDSYTAGSVICNSEHELQKFIEISQGDWLSYSKKINEIIKLQPKNTCWIYTDFFRTIFLKESKSTFEIYALSKDKVKMYAYEVKLFISNNSYIRGYILLPISVTEAEMSHSEELDIEI